LCIIKYSFTIFLFPATVSLSFLLSKINQTCPRSNYISGSSAYPLDKILFNLTFSKDTIYHHDGIAYDYYSINDLEQSKAGYQWKIWPLPNEINQSSSLTNIEISPFVISKIPFINVIYVITDPRLKERHFNLKKAFDHQGISFESVNWRMKWNYTTCNSNLTHEYVYQRLNLKDKPLGNYINIILILK
jgi:hypothetical protein